jgi:hypothetical protein
MNTHVRDDLLYLHGDSGAITISNTLTLPASDPIADNQATRKLYVDNLVTARSIWVKLSDPGTQVYNATAPTTWTDLNLSSVVGTNRAMVFLQVGPSTTTPSNVYFRPNGTTSTINDGVTFGASSETICVYILVTTDASGIVEWYCTSAATNMLILLKGYAK